MKIKIVAKHNDAIAIRELLSPWNATYTRGENADVTIFYDQEPTIEEHSVIIPSKSKAFKTWAKSNSLGIDIKSGSLITVPATTHISLSIKPSLIYSFDSEPDLYSEKRDPAQIDIKDDSVALKVNVVEEFKRILQETLNPEESLVHKIATRTPLYNIVPKRLRNLFFRSDQTDLSLINKLPIDALRFTLVNAIERASNRNLEKKALYSDNYVCILTHDVETASGLQRAKILKRIEQKYDARSAWYLPSKRFELQQDTIKDLAHHGEIGVHDTKHDGKLGDLSKLKLVERFSEAKNSLEKIVEHKLEGFRAPLLQHNSSILQALRESDFKYDTSIPTWEPKHPFTMKPHGIGTVYPIAINGLVEIPLTLPQDHQLLYALNMKPEEVMRTWAEMVIQIRELEGVCMFLVHPDYKFGDQYANLYEELVNIIVNDRKATVTLPSRLCGLLNEYQSVECL